MTEREYILVGWEFNNIWKGSEVYKGEKDETLLTVDEIDKATSYRDFNQAYAMKCYLQKTYSDITWYVVIK